MNRLKSLFLLLAGSLALSGCSFDVYKLPLPGGADTGEDPMTVTVMFRDVLDLVPQSTVKVADVSVGKVTDVELSGYNAKVTVEIRNDTELPDNAVAEIRQTSLLGEKFVSLKAPETGASDQPLNSGDVIDLDRSGRNPEVEEVLGALSLLLNGGGVAQLKTIASELNNALEGREGSARSVLTQIQKLVGQLDDNKGDIVRAIEALNRLSISVNGQMDTIDLALEELPSAVRSLDRQRDDLVKMLAALNRLSNVGVRVIGASKEATIDAFRSLRPVLKAFADAGSDLPYSLQTLLTYPFVDETVGRNPQVAENLHMGDYVNLSVVLDLDLNHLGNDSGGLPVTECIKLSEIPKTGPLPPLADLCKGALSAVQECMEKPSAQTCGGLPTALLSQVCKGLTVPMPGLCPATSDGTGGGGNGGGGLTLPDVNDLLGLGRPGFGAIDPARGPTVGQLMQVYDPALVTLLVPGMVVR